jgi:hypothetical protein
MNIVFAVFVAEEQHLGDNQVGLVVVYRSAEKDNPVLQQPGIDIVGPLCSTAFLYHYRY